MEEILAEFIFAIYDLTCSSAKIKIPCTENLTRLTKICSAKHSVSESHNHNNKFSKNFFRKQFLPEGNSQFNLSSNIFMNIFASWSKLNSFKFITIKPKTLKLERNNQRFVECQRYANVL